MSAPEKIDLFRQFEAAIGRLSGQKGCEVAMVILCFPLLERYLRETSGAGEASSLPDKFMDDLLVIFPEIGNRVDAREFWQVYRHGLLHHGAFSAANSKHVIKPYAAISGETPRVYFDAGAQCYFVNPELFSTAVLDFIRADLETFQAKKSGNHEQPSVGRPFGGTQPFVNFPTGNFPQ